MSSEEIEQYRSNLSLVKAMPEDKAEEEFYQLMEKAKNSFGELGIHMAEFYFQYAKFLLEKMEKNIDIFNAGSLPVGDAAPQHPIPEDMYEDDSSMESNSEEPAKSQNNAAHNNQKAPEDPSKPDQPVITENEQAPVQNQNQVNENQGQDDDYEVCYENLLCAIKIFQTERDRLKDGGEEGAYSLPDVLRWISRCKSRLGDLHHLSQNYVEAVNVYREVVEAEEQKLGHESNRGLAEIHYMIANSFLYDNKQGCEKAAISEFIKSFEILISHLSLLTPLPPTAHPTLTTPKIDRFPFLPTPSDTAQTRQIKQVLSLLLDKIEDTHEQISIRSQYEAQKLKNKVEEQEGQFKEISPQTKVVKLGTFGNRKKKGDDLQPDEKFRKNN